MGTSSTSYLYLCWYLSIASRPQGRYIAVAASLTGGNALAAFVRMVQQWCMELGCR